MKAQSRDQESDVAFLTEMEESCDELPLKVEVQTKAQTGSRFIFPGSGITQGSDNSDSPYGGVVYKYSSDGRIRFIVPRNENGKILGVAVFSGKYSENRNLSFVADFSGKYLQNGKKKTNQVLQYF
jgi:hypothetical protein